MKTYPVGGMTKHERVDAIEYAVQFKGWPRYVPLDIGGSEVFCQADDILWLCERVKETA